MLAIIAVVIICRVQLCSFINPFVSLTISVSPGSWPARTCGVISGLRDQRDPSDLSGRWPSCAASRQGLARSRLPKGPNCGSVGGGAAGGGGRVE